MVLLTWSPHASKAILEDPCLPHWPWVWAHFCSQHLGTFKQHKVTLTNQVHTHLWWRCQVETGQTTQPAKSSPHNPWSQRIVIPSIVYLSPTTDLHGTGTGTVHQCDSEGTCLVPVSDCKDTGPSCGCQAGAPRPVHPGGSGSWALMKRSRLQCARNTNIASKPRLWAHPVAPSRSQVFCVLHEEYPGPILEHFLGVLHRELEKQMIALQFWLLQLKGFVWWGFSRMTWELHFL